MAASVLIVGHDEEIRRALSRSLRREGYEPLEAATGEEALALVGLRPVDVIVADGALSGMTAFELLEVAGRMQPDAVGIALDLKAWMAAAAARSRRAGEADLGDAVRRLERILATAMAALPAAA